MPDQLIVQHCSPTLAGLKTGNLFSMFFASEEGMVEELRKLNRTLTKKGLRAAPLRRKGQRYLVYLYRPDYLCLDLAAPEAVAILEEQGYVVDTPTHCLVQLARRMEQREDFPHEVGLFLGYPPSDVRCFMEDKTCGVKTCGHWKAYSNEEEAERAFARYRKCTKQYCRQIVKGKTLEQLIVQTKGRSI